MDLARFGSSSQKRHFQTRSCPLCWTPKVLLKRLTGENVNDSIGDGSDPSPRDRGVSSVCDVGCGCISAELWRVLSSFLPFHFPHVLKSILTLKSLRGHI